MAEYDLAQEAVEQRPVAPASEQQQHRLNAQAKDSLQTDHEYCRIRSDPGLVVRGNIGEHA